MSRDPVRAPFRDDLSSADWNLIPLQTKFEVSNYSDYKDMKSGAKCRHWGSLGRLGVTQDHWQCHHSTERIQLPIRL